MGDDDELLAAVEAAAHRQDLQLSFDQGVYENRYGTTDGFDALDSNRDGIIDRSEWHDAQRALAPLGGDDDEFALLMEAAGGSNEDLAGDGSHVAIEGAIGGVELPALLIQDLQMAKPKTPLMFMNDDGEEFELRTPSPCDSIAASNYEYDEDD